jgi:hypothetical protein
MAVAFLAGTGGLAISTKLTVPTGAAVVLGASLAFFLTLVAAAIKRESIIPLLRSPKAAGAATAAVGLALVAHGLLGGDVSTTTDALSRSASDVQHEVILGVLLVVAGGSYFKFGWPLKRD